MPDAQFNFQRGNDYLARGALQNAIASYEGALGARPSHTMAHYKASLAYLQLGNLGEAEAHSAAAIRHDPDLADAHNILGLAHLRQGRFAEAESNFRNALALDPYHSTALCNLGSLLAHRGQHDQSVSFLRRAVILEPALADALYNFGMAHAFLGAYDEAEVLMRRALGINAEHHGAILASGDFLSAKGRFADAEAFYRRSLSLQPGSPAAWSALAGLRTMTVADDQWRETAESLLGSGIRPDEEIVLRFALGKYWDDVRGYEQAFANFVRANELSRTLARNPYDAKARTRLIDQLIGRFDRPTANQAFDGSSHSQRPVFIVGMPRSGTTLVEQIIASHPDAFGAGELNFWGNAFKQHQGEILGMGSNGALIRDLSNRYHQHLDGFNRGAVRIVDKMPGNFAYLGLIRAAFPNARIIHTRRDPRDTCLSIYFQRFAATHNYANDLASLPHYYREYRRLMAHWREVLPADAILDVPYESLIADQERWSRLILQFIGLEWDERCMAFEKTERRVATASKWQVRQKIYKTSVGRWRNYEKFIGPLMQLKDLEW